MDLSLLDYLNEYFDKLTQDDKLQIFSKIVDGLHHCHVTQKIMHRDLKLENILVNVDKNNKISSLKIADFGLACKINTLESDRYFCGTVDFMAPE